jgi:hypothetical protein
MTAAKEDTVSVITARFNSRPASFTLQPHINIEEIKRGLDITDVAGQYTALKKEGDHFKGCCPLHPDTNPSFAVYPNTGRFVCFGCQQKGDVIDLIEKAEGLNKKDAIMRAADMAGLPDSTTRPGPAGVVKKTLNHSYKDEKSVELYQAVRKEFYNAPKKITQRRPDGKGGWLWSLGDTRRVLYRLPELLAADLKATVYVAEGEPKVDALLHQGLVATCNVGGAGNWRPEYSQALAGRHVVILPDNDEPGRKHAQQVLASIWPHVASAKIVEIPGLEPKGDIYDWLQAGHTAQELTELAAATESILQAPSASAPSVRVKPKTISAKELIAKEFAPLEYIVPGILPTGSSLLASKPKLGKSWMILNIAIAVAAGGVALSQTVKKGAALYLALEDNEPRLKRRLAKLCPDGVPDGLDFATDWKRSDQGGLEDLEEWLQDHPDTRFVAIDTLQKWRKPASGRDNIYNADYEALDGVTRLASKYGVSIVIAHHTRKGTSEDPLEEVSGSNGLTGAVDNALILSRSRGEADAVIYRIGRDLEEDAPLALSFDKRFAIWSVLGNAEEHALTLERQEIIKLLKDNENGLFPSEIAKQLGKNRVTVQSILTEMKEAGQVSQEAFKKPYKLGNLDNLGNYTNLGNLGNSEENEEAPEPVLTDTTGIDEPSTLWSSVDISNTVGEVSVVAQVAQVADSFQENLTQSEAYTGYARLIETLEDYYTLKPLLEEIQRSHEITNEEKFNLCSAGSKRLEELMF